MSIYTRGNARRSLFDTVIFRVAAQAATAISYVILARAMSREDFGLFNLLYSFIPVVGTVASLGLEQTLRRFQPEYLAAGNRDAAGWLFRYIARLRLGSNLVILSIVLLAWDLLAPVFKMDGYQAQFILFCVPMLLHFQFSILQISLASHMLQRHAVGSIALMSVLKCIAYAALAATDQLNLTYAVWADTFIYAGIVVYLRVTHARLCAAAPPAGFRVDREEKRRLIRYGLYNNFNDTGSLALDARADNFYIAAFVNTAAVGVYSFYSRIGEMVLGLLPVRMFDSVIQPLVFATPRDQAPTRIPRVFSLLMNLSLVVQWPLFAMALVYHEEMVRLVFGTKYVADSWLLPIVFGFMLLNSFGTPATMVAQYQEKARMIMLSKVFALYNIGALLLLVPTFGVYGAAFATRSSHVLKNLFIWWNARALGRWLNGWSAVGWGLLVWGTMAAAGFALERRLMLPDIGDLAVGAALATLAGLVHLRTPALSSSDRALLGSVLGGREAALLRRLGVLRAPAPGAMP